MIFAQLTTAQYLHLAADLDVPVAGFPYPTQQDMPAGGRWIEWMSDPSRGDAAVVAVPCDEGVISCVCMPCLQKTIDSMAQESLPDNA